MRMPNAMLSNGFHLQPDSGAREAFGVGIATAFPASIAGAGLVSGGGEKEREPEVLPLISARTNAGAKARSEASASIFSDPGKSRDDMSLLEGERKE